MTTATSPYLTLPQASAYLNVSTRAIYRLVEQHGLPFCRVGRLYRFDQRELDAWMHGRETVPVPVAARRA
jgi:excisionase family DNA binding protein